MLHKTMPLDLLACKFKVLHSTFLGQHRVMLHLLNRSVGMFASLPAGCYCLIAGPFIVWSSTISQKMRYIP